MTRTTSAGTTLMLFLTIGPVTALAYLAWSCIPWRKLKQPLPNLRYGLLLSAFLLTVPLLTQWSMTWPYGPTKKKQA